MTFAGEEHQPSRQLRSVNLDRVGAPHAFGTRHETPRWFDAAFGPIWQARQVHGAGVITLEGQNNPDLLRHQPADALIATSAGQAVGIRTADCVPVLLFDPARNVAAAVHAGWRGVVAGVLETTLELLVEQQGCAPSGLIAAIGPAIGVCHFEVGDDVARHFDHVPAAVVETPGRRPHVDLRRVVFASLRDAGLAQIDCSEACTYCGRDLYHSFRRDGAEAGRQLSVIATRPDT
jgi:YfiH family protein